MSSIYSLFKKCTSVSIDSRTIQNNALFFALNGNNHDGHHYVATALEKGARYAIIDNPDFKLNSACILVDDSLKALQELATFHRSQLSHTTVIAIVGSNGKTTTKNLIEATLATTYKTQATIGNYNNHIGVPLTILSLTLDCEFAVIEMGANHPNEHKFLCHIAQPNAGIVTNCGKDHLEGYGSIEGVIDANCELFDYLRKTQGTAFVNYHDSDLTARLNDIHTIYYAQSDTDHESTLITGACTKLYPFVCLAINQTNPADSILIESNLMGTFQANNILAAACIGLHYQVAFQAIKQAIESYIPSNNRSQLIKWKSNTVILDAYNANPSSMIAMIEYFEGYPSNKKIVILGDMFELGANSSKEHADIVNRLNKKSFKAIILVGHCFKLVKDKRACYHVNNVAELRLFLEQQHYQNHVFLVKGSRGMALENAF